MLSDTFWGCDFCGPGGSQPGLSVVRVGRQNSAQLAVCSFTTGSGRFASYVTNGLSKRLQGERDLLNEREEKSSSAFNSHGNLHLGWDSQTLHKYKLGGYCGRLLLSVKPASKGTWSDLVASSRFVFIPTFVCCFLKR